MVFEVTVLGSSSALPSSKRYPSAHVLKSHERIFLIDCGEGTQMQLRRNRFGLGRINNIFISHTHGDHIFGLYGLISTMNLLGRKYPLMLYAPAGFHSVFISHLSDFDIRLNFELVFIGLEGKDPRDIYEDKYIKVTSLPLKHRIPTYGFLFREKLKDRNIIRECIPRYRLSLKEIKCLKKGEDIIRPSGEKLLNSKLTYDPPVPRSFAYCSDTSYFRRLASFVSGVDLLYHDSTFGSDLAELAKETGHSTAAEAAMIAREANVGKLLLGHFSARYKDIKVLLEEAREVFDNTIAAEDNMRIEL